MVSFATAGLRALEWAYDRGMGEVCQTIVRACCGFLLGCFAVPMYNLYHSPIFKIRNDIMTVSVAVQIPEPLYHRLEQAAARLQKPVENLLVETLQAALPDIAEIPDDIRTKISALDKFDDTALHDIAESEMISKDQQILERLLEVQSMRPLTDEEISQLTLLRKEYGRILLCKARAFALLAERGHPISIK